MLIPTLSTEVPGDFMTAALWNGTVIGGLTAAQNPVIFKGYATTASGNLPGTSASTPVALDSEEIDTDGGHSTTTNTSRYVCQTAGIFVCIGYCLFSRSASGQRGVEILKNGASLTGMMGQSIPSASMDPSTMTLNIVRLAVGDYVELGVWASTANITTAITTRTSPTLIAVRISN